MLKVFRLHARPVDRRRRRRRDMHGDVLADLRRAARKVDEHADLAAHVDVARDAARSVLIALEAAQ